MDILVLAIIVFVVVPALAVPFGAESRPGFDEQPPGSGRHFGVLR